LFSKKLFYNRPNFNQFKNNVKALSE